MAGVKGYSGGLRVNAGRPRKDKTLGWLGGHSGKRGKAPAKPTAVPVLPVVPMPELPAEQQAVWSELAPHAREARTLIPSTAGAFRDLCEAIVLKRALLARIEQDGLTYLKVSVDGAGVEHTEIKAHPLLAQHRGMMQ